MNQPPPTRRDDVTDVLHGEAVPDPYRWLEDGTDPDVRDWVAQHNQRTNQALDARPDRTAWHERLIALMQLPITSGGTIRGDQLFVDERPAGAEQFQLTLRSASDPNAAARVLIDPAAWSDDGAVALDWSFVSPDGRFVAYGVSEGGTERSTLRILAVDSGELLADEIADVRAASVAWLPDSDGFFYTRYPPGVAYHRRVYLHRLGAELLADELVWGEGQAPETWPSVRLSRDGRYLLVHAMVGWGRTDVHLLDRTTNVWQTLIEGVQASSSFSVVRGRLVGVTTLGASNGRIVVADLESPTADSWKTLIPEGSGVRGEFVAVGDELISHVSERAIDRLERHHLVTGEFVATIEGPGVASLSAPSTDRADDAEAAFFSVTRFDTPTSLWRWTSSGGAQPWIQTDIEMPLLEVSYRTYPSLDGTPIGLFLIHRAGLMPDATTPALLNGYGGFAIAETPMFSPMIAAFCEAGGLYAVAGLRGGFEEGEAWHQAGRRDRKQNVFDDFYAAADWLVVEGLTSRERLGIHGGSNGGLLVGVALTQRPDLCRAVWCAVPLLDMVRYPHFLIARLWTDEFGDPEVAEEFAWVYAYSPYHRVIDGQRYPSLLLTTAEGDSRVDPLHARKMAALMIHAAVEQDKRPILLREEQRAGHGAGKPVGKRAAELADVLAFFTWQLGFSWQHSPPAATASMIGDAR